MSCAGTCVSSVVLRQQMQQHLSILHFAQGGSRAKRPINCNCSSVELHKHANRWCDSPCVTNALCECKLQCNQRQTSYVVCACHGDVLYQFNYPGDQLRANAQTSECANSSVQNGFSRRKATTPPHGFASQLAKSLMLHKHGGLIGLDRAIHRAIKV